MLISSVPSAAALSPRSCRRAFCRRRWPARCGSEHSTVRPYLPEEEVIVLKLRDGVSLAELEYGMALLDERSGDYWALNPTGAIVLQALLGGKTAATAVDQLVGTYAVDPG